MGQLADSGRDPPLQAWPGLNLMMEKSHFSPRSSHLLVVTSTQVMMNFQPERHTCLSSGQMKTRISSNYADSVSESVSANSSDRPPSTRAHFLSWIGISRSQPAIHPSIHLHTRVWQLISGLSFGMRNWHAQVKCDQSDACRHLRKILKVWRLMKIHWKGVIRSRWRKLIWTLFLGLSSAFLWTCVRGGKVSLECMHTINAVFIISGVSFYGHVVSDKFSRTPTHTHTFFFLFCFFSLVVLDAAEQTNVELELLFCLIQPSEEVKMPR